MKNELLTLVPGVKHKLFDGWTEYQAEVVILNAQPFPNREGKMERMVLSRFGTNNEQLRVSSYLEERVHQIFKETGIDIPKPSVMPSPPPAPLVVEQKPQYPISVQVRIFFERFARALGMSRGHWLTVMFCCGVLVLVTATFLFIWLGRRARD